MQVKPGVILTTVHPYMQYGAMVFEYVHKGLGYGEATITGGNESAHGRVANTLHPTGRALDFRRWHVKDHALFQAWLRQFLGPWFDVVLEGDHYHVEFAPTLLRALGESAGVWT